MSIPTSARAVSTPRTISTALMSFDTTTRKRISALLYETLAAERVDFFVMLGESRLARLHFIARTPVGTRYRYDADAIEGQVARHEQKRDPFESPHRPLDMNDLPTLSAGELQALRGGGFMKEVLARTQNDSADGFVSGLSVMSPRDFKKAMSELSDSRRFGEVMEKVGAARTARHDGGSRGHVLRLWQ